MKYIVQQTQCGFLLKNGCLKEILFAGTYNYPAFLGYQMVLEDMKGIVKYNGLPMKLLMEQPEFSKRVTYKQIPDGFLGVLYKDGVLTSILSDKEAAYWNVWENWEIQLLDMRTPAIEEGVGKKLLSMIPSHYYKKIEIQPGEMGLLYENNRLTGQLTEGTYYYWLYSTDVLCRIVDLKTKEMEINGQEILTADRIGIRLNLVCAYRITDPERMVETIRGVESQLYSCIQLIVREYVGRYRLDEILEQKEEISDYLCGRLKDEEEKYCVEVQRTGIRDIILPGEIRDIMNTVLVAERKAQANVITRREEVASTRSLLNTAKLMEENKTLYKLKEMECLERICTQVGNINVAGSGNLLQQLKEILGN